MGLKPPASVCINVNTNGNGSAEVRFVNLAKSTVFWPWNSEAYKVENFKVEVLDSGGLNLSMSGLENGGVLNPGEEDRATLRVWGAEPRDDDYKVVLRLTYSTFDGNVCSKRSLLYVRVKK
jgi:hypothetical protein